MQRRWKITLAGAGRAVAAAGLSRIFAVYSSRIPKVIGPVRSARQDDLALLRQFGKPGFAYSGATPHLLPFIARARVVNLYNTPAYFRDGNRAAPHNLYADGRVLRAETPGASTARDRGAPPFPDRDPIGFLSGKERDRMPGKPKHYTPEFKEQAVRKVVDSSPPRTIAEVARELNVNDTTLGFWVKAFRKKLAGEPLPSDMPDDERVRELERRVRELEMENTFLKKAAAYFAREHR